MRQKFMAEIKKHEGINGAYVEIPFDVEDVFGAKRVKVKAYFDGKEYRGSIVRMAGCYMIGLTQALRKEIGKESGDIITVEVEKDEEERIIEMPEDFKIALGQNPSSKDYFEKLSFSRKKEYVTWITGAKKAETRNARMEKALVMLAENKKLK
ncbi:MAG: antitermination protein NusB [Desulfitibacter sp. BRH_c19]|nr:MAG: antitermination protein NusB [Desulfitibacter sp. BRH_c19]